MNKNEIVNKLDEALRFKKHMGYDPDLTFIDYRFDDVDIAMMEVLTGYDIDDKRMKLGDYVDKICQK